VSTPSLELPTLTAPQQQSVREPAERDRLIRRAKALSWLSLAYMTAEGAIAITAAILAGSVALLGFGLDSAIEALASIIVIWRFTGTRRRSEHAEQRAQRFAELGAQRCDDMAAGFTVAQMEIADDYIDMIAAMHYRPAVDGLRGATWA